jgi:single-strand DNA-binding protein
MRDINSLNRVMLIGHLGGDPEIRYIPQTERPVARFTLATNERLFNPTTNETSDRTEWHRIVAWGKLAEFCEKYLNRGRQIYLEGKLRTRNWQDKEGNKRYTTEINAQSIVLLGKREEAPIEVETAGLPPDDLSDKETVSTTEDETGDDEVPF